MIEGYDAMILKLFGGETVMGSVEVHGDRYLVKNPRTVVMMPAPGGAGVRIALMSICMPFKVKRLEESIEIPKSQVFWTAVDDEIDRELVNEYNSAISGIKIASAAETASINAAGKAGEFKL